MGRVYEGVEGSVADWIGRQHLFFVATAPLAGDGRVNLSPKGLDSFAVLDPHTVAYLDLVGSGVETIAHLRENGRITIMFCALEGPPRIVRLHGQGRVHLPGSDEFERVAAQFAHHVGARSVITVAVERVSDSCGYGVPTFRYEADRPTLDDWAERQGAEALATYQATKNATSIDGLTGLG